MVKEANAVWHNSGRKESEISIRYQYKCKHSPDSRPGKYCVHTTWKR